MGLLGKIIFIITLIGSSQANALELPQSLFDSLSTRLQFGQCQKEFLGAMDMYQELKTSDPQQTLLLIPCAQWAYNMRWLAYMVITDSKDKDKVDFIKPLYFTHHSAHKGLHSSEYIENYHWKEEKGLLFSRNFPNGNPKCGEMVLYEWSPLMQDFKVKTLTHKDDCADSEADWTNLFSESKQ